MSHLKNPSLLEHVADELHADRETSIAEPAGDTDGRQTGEIDRNRQQIRQIHGQGVVGVGTRTEGCGGSRRCQQNIHALKCRIKVTSDQRPHLLSFLVVSIDVARREGIGADQDPTLHLGAEPFSTTARRHRCQGLRILRSITVFHAVVTGEVRRRLGRRDHVVGRNSIGEAGTTQLHKLSAETLQLGGSRHDRLLHLRIKAVGFKAFSDQANLQSPNVLIQSGEVIRYRSLQAGGITGIRTSHHLKQLRRIRNAGRERADLV